MAKANTIKVKLLSTAETGYFYVTRKNSRTMTDKITQRKYDPVARKHVEFRETKIKQLQNLALELKETLKMKNQIIELNAIIKIQ